jgi:hypothetical protein
MKSPTPDYYCIYPPKWSLNDCYVVMSYVVITHCILPIENSTRLVYDNYYGAGYVQGKENAIADRQLNYTTPDDACPYPDPPYTSYCKGYFLIKHPKLIGYIFLCAWSISGAQDMKQTLTLISIANIFSHNSNPFICGILISTKTRS